MAVLKTKDIQKMTLSEREEKLKALQLELVKANVTAQKSTAKTKEIKKAIARLYTLIKLSKEVKKE